MIATLSALAVTAAVAGATPEPFEETAPLDDLTVLAVLLEAAAIEEEDRGFGYASGESESAARERRRHEEWERRRHDRDRYRHRRVLDDGAVLGPAKDALRRGDRFGLPRTGFVDMPGPGGAGGRIAAQSLGAGTEGRESDAEQDETTQAATLTGDASSEGGSAVIADGTDGAETSLQRAVFASPAGPPALRVSFAKSAMPAAPAAEDALPTPLPPSVLLFAGGLGLLRLSRRRLG